MLHLQEPGDIARVDTIELDFPAQLACQAVGTDLAEDLRLRLGDTWHVRAICIDRGRAIIWDAMP
jgi:hypothetical protein